MLAPDRGGRHWSMAAPTKALEADLDRQVQDNGYSASPSPPGDIEQLTSTPLLDVGRVNQSQQPSFEPDVEGCMQQRKGILAGGLVSLVIRDHRAKRIRGEDLGGREVCSREGRLAAPRDPNEHDHRVSGQNDHVANVAAGPTSGSRSLGSLLRTLLTASPTG